MPPELRGINQVDFNPEDGTIHLHYTTTAEHDFRDLVDRITLDLAETNVPDTTIHPPDYSESTWTSHYLNEERIKEIVRETVKELLEQKGFIVGIIPTGE